jgi:tetratricopeptide (TPR) repeat protein
LSEKEHDSIKKAEALIDIERQREAILVLTRVLASNPQNFHAVCLLARCFYELNENQEALKYAEKAIQIEPENEWGHRLRSIALGELGNKRESLKSAQEAVRLAPDEPSALQTFANALLRCGKTEEAKPVAEKVLEIAPDSETAHLTAGSVYLDLQYYQLAEKHCREALRINPASYNAQNNLGVIALRRDQKSVNAVEHFAHAVKLDPANSLAIENLRVQFSILPQLAVFILYIPLGLLGLLIAPVIAITFLIGGLFLVIKTFVANFNNRHLLAEEFRVLFKSESYQNRFKRSANLLWDLSRAIFLKIWLVYVFAIAAFVLRLLSFQYNSDLLKYAAFLIFLACPFIISKKSEE